ncbi:LamG-like jellyroll fold domain-containing protein [Serratia proteamaculans]|uniref:LamG-like jellyroll fold domain-containing protein n=1 Tax=Serratia proteamaculans TaxID=28151 RepID=UPI0039AED488
MSGVRIFCNEIIPITDWNHDFETINSKLQSKSPLPTIVSFDLMNPLDNARGGYLVSQGGAQVQPWGLHYENGAKPSPTTLVKPGQGAVSFLTAFRLSSLSRYINILSCRDTTENNGHGFNLYYSGELLMSFAYSSGAIGTISLGELLQPEVDKWYAAAGVFDPAGGTASVRFSELGLRYGSVSGNTPLDQTLNTAMMIGGDHNGKTTSSMIGDIAFAAIYDGAFTTEQRDTMPAVGLEVLKDRHLI